ncbi:MAG TPA: exo-alpha-sialidase [Anaerolineaceae bacterium]
MLITNCYDPTRRREKLPVERAWLYTPQKEWTYSHHASITFFKGKFYAIWSNGREHEDYPGQRVLIASSSDFTSWSEPKPLVGPLAGEHSELVLTAAGFHQSHGRLVAYFGAYEYKIEAVQRGIHVGHDHMDTCLWALTTEDGEHWSQPLNMHLPIVPNHGPQPTCSGRLIISGNISFPYSDDPTGLSGWKMTGIYPPEMADTIYDDAESFWIVQARQGWPAGLCEGSFYQTDDGILHMLLRTTGPGYAGKLWQTESHDDGATWQPPQESDFTDNNTKFHLGRLPDGRFYHVGSPDPLPRGARNPLVISLSRDGQRFEQAAILADEEYTMVRPGLHKGGLYGYPHTLLQGGYLYVIYSLRKEAVQVLRVALGSFDF